MLNKVGEAEAEYIRAPSEESECRWLEAQTLCQQVSINVAIL